MDKNTETPVVIEASEETVEKTPFWKRPLVIAGAAVVGIVAAAAIIVGVNRSSNEDSDSSFELETSE